MINLKAAIADDFKIFDNRITLYAVHRDSESVTLDFTNTTFNSTEVETKLEDCCLVRQISERETGTVRQLFERGKSITNDQVQMIDTIIEVWKPGTIIQPGDRLEERGEGALVLKKWMVLAVDDATLNTRLRAGCRSL